VKINILGSQKISPVNLQEIRRLVKFTLEREGIKKADVEIGLTLVDNRQITELNRKYLNRNCPTDVICFCFWEDEFYLSSEVLGEVIVSVEQAKKVAKELNKSLEEELYLYIIHGILHLIGYTDDTISNRKKMNERCEEILREWLLKYKRTG